MKKAGASYLLPPPTQLQAGLFLHFKAKYLSMLGVNPFTIFCDKSGKNQLTDLSSCIIRVCHKGISFLRRYLPAGACIWRKQKSPAGGVAELNSLIGGRLIKGGLGIGAEIPLCQILIMHCKDNALKSEAAKILTLNNIFNTMNPEDYVSYPIALALKKHGFDLEVNHVYDKNGELWEEGMNENAECDYTAYFNYNKSGYIEVSASAPTLAQAQKWLRNVHKFDMNIDLDDDTDEPYTTEIYKNKECVVGFWKLGFFATYESALSAGIAAALELIDGNKCNPSPDSTHSC